ncbi:hypothetical protein [Quadrisphaera sp. DSM 44207]|uniref:hypothetical protein n=1 Tax=Quadrisphaera sp. DSM 44207 TaxID=1881057 RepID=UPI00088E07B2|nr:hypothetical protein [Quadrisphaera sp. DSM 44207]SDQ22347.1 hypothetical protein SAMN05428996_1160 [Quadrisphaera sp. DSM 44207]
MSRTDKTRPVWVRLADTPMGTCRPVHDHKDGPCTLPEEITAASASASSRTSGCYWGVSDSYGQDSHDGCRECTGYHVRREERRRDRSRARRELRAYRDDDREDAAPASRGRRA